MNVMHRHLTKEKIDDYLATLEKHIDSFKQCYELIGEDYYNDMAYLAELCIKIFKEDLDSIDEKQLHPLLLYADLYKDPKIAIIKYGICHSAIEFILMPKGNGKYLINSIRVAGDDIYRSDEALY